MGLHDHEVGAQAKTYALVLSNLQFIFQGLTQEIDHDLHPWSKCGCIRGLQSNFLDE